MKKFCTALLLFVPLFLIAQSAQQTSIQGKIIDAESGEPVVFANVVLKKKGIFITGGESDFDGIYKITNINPGTYEVEVSQIEYNPVIIKDVIVEAGKANTLDVQMTKGQTLDEVVVTGYHVPLVEQDNVTSSCISPETIQRLPSKNIQAITGKVGGMASPFDGDDTSIKGSRADGTIYYIDGVRVNGTPIKEEDNANTQPDPHNTESYAYIRENPFLNPLDHALSTFSVDVDHASYTNTRRYLNYGSLPPVDAVRIEEFINYFDYDYPAAQGKHPFAVYTELGACPWNPEHRLVQIGIKGADIAKDQVKPSNLVFLLDVSGSMDSPDKLPLLKSAFKLLVDQLCEEDYVSIVVYAGASGLVLPPTSGAEKSAILAALENLGAGGSTAGAAGIQQAYEVAQKNFIKDGNNRILLATDGDFNIGISSDSELQRLIETKRDEGIFLSVLGFGTGNYKDSKMEAIANHGNGNYYYIDQIQEAERVLVESLAGTLFTIAKDVKIQVEFNPENVQAYRLIGYENRLLEDQDFNDDKKDAGEIGAGHTVTALYEIIPQGVPYETADIDPLKYQQSKARLVTNKSNEWMTVKMRYKKPNGDKSILLEQVVMEPSSLDHSANLQFAAAVASFGMILRDSEYLGESDFDLVLKLAKAGKGKDEAGYREEFIKLVQQARKLR